MKRFDGLRPALVLLLPAMLLATGLSACGEPADAPADPAAGVVTNTEGGAASSIDEPVAEDASGEMAGEDDSEEPQSEATEEEGSVGMISSGQAEAPPEVPEPEEPAQDGVPRFMTMNEAAAEAPFQAYEPTFLPEQSERDVVMLIAPRPGESDPSLPAINMIYTVASLSSFRIYQSPAGDRPYPDGKETMPATVGGAEAQLIRQGVTHVLAWEVGDTRIEIHSRDVGVETMQQIADGIVPLGQAGAATADEAEEAQGDEAGEADEEEGTASDGG